MKRFIFIKDIEALLTESGKELRIPEGTRLSAAAADFIKEKGITVVLANQTAEKPPQSEKQEEKPAVRMTKEPNKARGLIAVASEGDDITGQVGNVAARSSYFLIFDEQGQRVETLENPFRTTGGGAGPLVANFLAEKGVTGMVAQSFGVNMRASLQEKQVDHYAFSGSVQDALETLLKPVATRKAD